MNKLEQFLTDHYQGQATLTFQRGSTGLYVLLRALRELKGSGEVIIPTICCETVLMAVIYSGMTPIIADVEVDTLCASRATISAKITDKTKAVVVVHIFGNAIDSGSFEDLRQQNDILFIDDIAQAVGGQIDGNLIGTGLDATLLSFADDKIIGGEGGAIVLGEKACKAGLARAMEKISAKLPKAVSPRQLDQLALSLRNFSHGMYDLLRAKPDADISKAYRDVIGQYRDLIVLGGGVSGPQGIIDQIRNVSHNREKRIQRQDYYLENINSPHIKFAHWQPDATCWRLPLFIDCPENTSAITALLRAEGIPASNHYFPLDLLYVGRLNAANERFALCLLNLWVDDTVSDEQADKTIEIINSFSPASTKDRT